MVINQRIGLAMAEQADRVNSGRSAQQKLDDAREEIRTLKQRLEISEAKAQEYRQRAELAEAQPTVIRGIVGSHGSLTTPAEFAESHHTSVSTVNRALNNDELMGIRQPNNRWLVFIDQVWTPKRKRGSDA